MNEAIMIFVEKEQHEELLKNYHRNIELTFKQIHKRVHRVFNKATGRFHNIELRIDEVM